jgi:hypothetical protein
MNRFKVCVLHTVVAVSQNGQWESWLLQSAGSVRVVPVVLKDGQVRHKNHKETEEESK